MTSPRLQPPSDADSFACEIAHERDTATVRPAGSLDIATVPILETHITELRKKGIRRMILDLSGLHFMDSSGLRSLLACDAAARQDGFAVAVIQGPPAVQRVFELTDTTEHLRFIDR